MGARPDQVGGWRIGSAGLLGLLLVCRADLAPYDDGLFFVRFARNFLDAGVFAWNVEDGPVHGNTSQLLQLLVTGLGVATPDHLVFATRLLLAGGLLAAVLLLVRDPSGSTGSAGSPASPRIPALLVLTSPMALATVLSGLETGLVLGLLAWFVVVLARQPPGRWTDGLLAALVPVLYLARPDTAVLTVGSLALFRRWRPLAAGVVGLAATLGLLWAGYGTALPLSFYVKSGLSGLYDTEFLAMSAEAKREHALYAALILAPLLWLQPRVDPRLAAPAALFCAYHLGLSVDVMGLHGRFYAPVLPLLVGGLTRGPEAPPRWALAAWAVWVVACGVAAAADLVPGNEGWPIGRVHPAAWVAYAAAALAATAPLARSSQAGLILGLAGIGIVAAGGPRARLPDDGQYAAILSGYATSWRGMDPLVRCLGPRIHVYHSEIGVPGVVFREGRVTDLSGLMNEETTLGGASFEALCQRDRPEAIFLPHRNYVALNQHIVEGECLRGYRRVVAKGTSPLYVRADRLAAYRCGPAEAP